MTSSELLTPLLSWLLTYFVHSSLTLGAALLIDHLCKERPFALREFVWRFAIIAPLATSFAQVSIHHHSAVAHIELGSSATVVTGSDLLPATTGEQYLRSKTTGAQDGASESLTTPWTSFQAHWQTTLLAFWSFGVLAGAIRIANAKYQLRRLLLQRTMRPPGRFVRTLSSIMGLRKPPRLSTSRAIFNPFAIGVLRPEVCLPERIIDNLETPQLNGILAHEIAHIQRRDPAWLVIYQILGCLLFLQPLNRLAYRRLNDLSEFLADRLAVACTGDRLSLASSLVEVATRPTPINPALMMAGAANKTALVAQRVERLLSCPGKEYTMSRWTPCAATAALIAALFVLPTVSISAVAMNEVNEPEKQETNRELQPETPVAAPTVALNPEPAAVPAPPAIDDPGVVPAPPAVPDVEAATRLETEILAQKLRQAFAQYQAIEERKELLTQNHELTPEDAAKLEELENRLRSEIRAHQANIEARQAELRARLEQTRERSEERTAARREAEFKRQKAREEAQELREREHQRAVSRRDSIMAEQHAMLERQRELELREQQLAERERELSERERRIRERERQLEEESVAPR